jgi:hypothetical protein
MFIFPLANSTCRLSDNYFDLLPGETVEITAPAARLRSMR